MSVRFGWNVIRGIPRVLYDEGPEATTPVAPIGWNIVKGIPRVIFGRGAPQGAILAHPLIMTYTPLSGAKVTANSVMTVTFNQDMLDFTINTNTFFVTKGTAIISGIVSYSPSTRTATFTPTTNLSLGGLFNATVTTGIQGANGLPMTVPFSWGFNTGSGRPITKEWVPRRWDLEGPRRQTGH